VPVGNYRQSHYEATFDLGDCEWDHDFDLTPGECANLNGLGWMAEGQRVCIALLWNDWPQTDQDYDMHLYRNAGGAVEWVSSFAQLQDGDDPPVEGGCFETTANDWYYFLVDQFNATADHYFEVVAFEGEFGVNVPESSVIEPATADGAVAVSAFPWDNPAQIADYSSRGPRNPLGGGPYDPNACGAHPTADCKPDFAGPANVTTVSYGQVPYGRTGIAAAHVAGAAALVRGAFPNRTADEVYDFLRERAIRPGGAPSGSATDDEWG